MRIKTKVNASSAHSDSTQNNALDPAEQFQVKIVHVKAKVNNSPQISSLKFSLVTCLVRAATCNFGFWTMSLITGPKLSASSSAHP